MKCKETHSTNRPPSHPSPPMPMPHWPPPLLSQVKGKSPKEREKRGKRRGEKRNGIWNASAGEAIQTNRRPHDSAVTLRPALPPPLPLPLPGTPPHTLPWSVQSNLGPPYYASALLAGFYLPGFHLAVNATLSRFSTLTTTCCSFNCLLPTAPAPAPAPIWGRRPYAVHVQFEKRPAKMMQ